MADVAEVLANLFGGYAKGTLTAMEEEESNAGTRVKIMETFGGGPQGAFEMFGDDYLSAVELATRGPYGRGLRVPTREVPTFEKQQVGERVLPRQGYNTPSEVGAARAAESMWKSFPVFGEVQTGTRRELALPKRTGMTFADIFPEAADTPIGALPIPTKDGEFDLSTASLVADRLGLAQAKVSVTIGGQTFRVTSGQAADIALRRLQQGGDELVGITIMGRTLQVPATTAANILSSYRNALLREGEGGAGEDRVEERDWNRQLREAEADLAAAQAYADDVRSRGIEGAVQVPRSSNPQHWRTEHKEEYAKAQAALAQARARLRSLQEQRARRGSTQGMFPDAAKNKGRVLRFTSGPLQGKRYRSDGTQWIEITDAATVTQ